jgi:deoxyribodipyrimidine photo-lyase
MSEHPPLSVVWFRQDLRLSDNPAILAAAKRGAPIVALYILDDVTPGAWKIGGAARWWLHHSLTGLAKVLAGHNVPLILRRGKAETILPAFIREAGADAIFWNRCYEPFAVARDTALKPRLRSDGIIVESFNAGLIAEPWTITTHTGAPYKVFTPFWRALRSTVTPEKPLKAPKSLLGFAEKLESDRLDDWALLPTAPNWADGIGAAWKPGEAGAGEQWETFLDHALGDYKTDRDLPGIEGVSRLSPYLHWGEISIREVWHAAETRGGPDAEPYLRELAWREFSHHLLWQFPALPDTPFQPRFAEFPWRSAASELRAWQKGLTGYPLVDAGMRELWRTGWMHNRVRMVVASFLVKHLLLPWRDGEAWFWDTLVDADLAANAMNWQWVAGSGADAAPYFRIFNPVLQGEKFDSDGAYTRKFVPELAALPDRWLHKPWMAPPDVLHAAGVTLGSNYPEPLVNHDVARQRALAALASLAG